MTNKTQHQIQVFKGLTLHGCAPEFFWQDVKGVVVGGFFPLVLDALKWAGEQGFNQAPRQTLAGWALLDDDNGSTLQLYKAEEEDKARRVAAGTGGVTVQPLYY